MYKMRNSQNFVIYGPGNIRPRVKIALDAPWDSFNQGTLQSKFDIEYEKLLMYLARMKRLKRRLTLEEVSEIRIIFELLLDTNEALY